MLANDRGYVHWRFTPVGRDRWLRELSPLALRQSELKISEANAGAKPPECTSASQWTYEACVRGL